MACRSMTGRFAVYPQDYADQENLCTQSVTQGSPDVESPHAGATGSNVTVNSCDPGTRALSGLADLDGGLCPQLHPFDTGVLPTTS